MTSSHLVQVSRLGFGCAGLSGALNTPLSHEAACLLIKRAFEKGITFYDTADVYGQDHENEIMIGKVMPVLISFHASRFNLSLISLTLKILEKWTFRD